MIATTVATAVVAVASYVLTGMWYFAMHERGITRKGFREELGIQSIFWPIRFLYITGYMGAASLILGCQAATAKCQKLITYIREKPVPIEDPLMFFEDEEEAADVYANIFNDGVTLHYEEEEEAWYPEVADFHEQKPDELINHCNS